MSEIQKPELELALTVIAHIDPPVAMGSTPHGDRRVIPISGGEFMGSNLKGIIMPGGEDWQLTRSDGVTELDARYWLQTDDGVIIRVTNRALLVTPSAPHQKRTVRCSPTFDAPIGKYDWLNKAIFLGTLSLNTPPTSVTLHFFKVL